MKQGQLTELIGLAPLKDVLNGICENGAVYALSYAAPPHFLLNLEPGNGQSTVARHIARVYQKANVRRFGGLDAFLEFSLDGTMAQMKQVFGDIKSSAVYTNEYEGVVALDISALAAHINEAQADVFFREIKQIAAFATFVFYITPSAQRHAPRLAEKLCGAVENVEIIAFAPYTKRELAAMIELKITERGIRMEDDLCFGEYMALRLTEEEIISAKQAVRFAEKMIRSVRFEGMTAVLGRRELEAAFTCGAELERCVNR